MARKVIVTPNALHGGDHIVAVDDKGMGTAELNRKAPLSDIETMKTAGHARMMRQQPARGSKEGTVNSKWSR